MSTAGTGDGPGPGPGPGHGQGQGQGTQVTQTTTTSTGAKLYPIDLAQKIVIKSNAAQATGHRHQDTGVTAGAGVTTTTSSVTTANNTGLLHQISIMRPGQQQIITSAQIKHLNQPVSGGNSSVNPLLQSAHIISQGTQSNSGISNQGTVHTLSASVRLLSPLNVPIQQHHIAVPVSASPRPSTNPVSQTTAIATKQITTSHHVPRGPAAGASLAVPRASVAPRVASPAASGWAAMGSAQIRPSTVVYTPRQTTRPHTLQVSTTRPTLRPQVTQSAVVARAVRPVSINAPASQRTPSPQAIQATSTPLRATAPKVLPLVSRNYPQAKLVAALGVRPAITRNVGGTYYYELSPSNVNNLNNQQSVGSMPSSTVTSSNIVSSSIAATSASNIPITSIHSLPINISNTSSIHSFSSFAGAITGNANDNRPPSSPQRPSILRKRENEGSPMKNQCPQNISPLPSPGGSTTVSATSSPGPDDDEPIPPPSLPPQPLLQAAAALQFNNCSPRKKPRKQMLSSESRIGSRGDCEFPSDGRLHLPSPPTISPPPPVPPPEKPPKRATLDYRCGWRATALHFMRPTDVRRKDERRPSVVELASQKMVLQKANGWKIHHLTAQMEDLGELEASIYKQMANALDLLEANPHPDLHKLCELLKGNIQRSRIVGEGVAEAKANVLKVFQHKPHVSDILARQADKRCFKKHRNQC